MHRHKKDIRFRLGQESQVTPFDASDNDGHRVCYLDEQPWDARESNAVGGRQR